KRAKVPNVSIVLSAVPVTKRLEDCCAALRQQSLNPGSIVFPATLEPATLEPAQVRPMLHAAAAAGIGLIVRSPSPRTGASYDASLTRLLESLLTLRFEAELVGVQVALTLPAGGMLVSPAEARDFLDAVNTPWIGAALDLVEISKHEHAREWPTSLNRRI